jgi:hypothetical protein
MGRSLWVSTHSKYANYGNLHELGILAKLIINRSGYRKACHEAAFDRLATATTPSPTMIPIAIEGGMSLGQ